MGVKLLSYFVVLIIVLTSVSSAYALSDYVQLSVTSEQIYLGDDSEVIMNVKGKDTTVMQTIPSDVVIILDTSGSMRYNLEGTSDENIPTNERRLGVARESAKEFVDLLAQNPENRVSLVTLTHEAQEVIPLTAVSSASSIKSQIDSLRACGGTNYYLALKKAKEILEASGRNVPKVVVFLSDGKPTTSNLVLSGTQCDFSIKYQSSETVDGDSYTCSGTYYQHSQETHCSGGSTDDHDTESALVGADLVKNAGISLYTIGFGNQDQLDGGLLQQMASSLEQYSFAGSEGALNQIYQDISTEVSNTVANDVKVTLQLPADVLFEGTHAETDGVTLTENGNQLTWNIGTLSKAEDVSMSFYVTPQKAGTFPIGTNAYAEFVDPFQQTSYEPFPEDSLLVLDPSPVIESIDIYNDPSCAELLPTKAPLQTTGCVVATISDDNLASATADLSAIGGSTTASGACEQKTFGSIPYTYECVFSPTPITIPTANVYPVTVYAVDENGNSDSAADTIEFQSSSCTADVALRLRGDPEHTILATLTNSEGTELASKTITHGSSNDIYHLSIPNVQGGNDITLTLQGGPYALADNPVEIAINGFKTYPQFSFNDEQYQLSMPLTQLAQTDNICEMYCIETPESCNMIDDDCDGTIDEYSGTEGLLCGDCSLGERQTCNTAGQGVCAYGTKECVENPYTSLPSWSSCESTTEPTSETAAGCDNLDNDCDGSIDEGLSCGDDVCVSGEVRSCECSCDTARVLMILDDNNHNEDLADFDQIYNDLLDLGVNVERIKEEDLAGDSDGFTYDDIKDYDLVWFSNPGYPPDDEKSLRALLEYHNAGNPIVMQGDDMTHFSDPELITELTGFINPSPTTNAYNGYDADHTVTFANSNQALLAGLAGKSFLYQGDDIDVTRSTGNANILATAVCDGANCGDWQDRFGSYSPIPVISVIDDGFIDSSQTAKKIQVTTLLTFSKIRPVEVRKLFTANIVNYLLNMAGKCECGEATPPACGIARQECVDGNWAVCAGVPLPTDVEICDGVDNDCDCWPLNDGNGEDTNGDGTVCGPGDKNVDEGLQCDCSPDDPPIHCGPTVEVPGICKQGILDCVETPEGSRYETSCDNAVYTDLYVDHEYGNDQGGCTSTDCGVCLDGIDNDCDGYVDQDDPDCPCVDNDADGLCDSKDSCVATPNGPKLGTCIPDVTADTSNPEIYTVSGTCTSDAECGSLGTCAMNNQEDACACIPLPEICDGIDNNCDGNIDEGLQCDCTSVGEQVACGSASYCFRTCSDTNGTLEYTSCMNTNPENPFGPFQITDEICGNGIDEDCNGIDDPCPVSDVTCDDVVQLQSSESAPTEFTGNIAYFIPEVDGSVRLADPIPFEFTPYMDLHPVEIEFDIKRAVEYDSIFMDKPVIDHCEINGDKAFYERIFKQPTESDVIINCLSFESNQDACFSSDGLLRGNLLRLPLRDDIDTSSIIDELIDQYDTMNISCYIATDTNLATPEGVDTCGACEQKITVATSTNPVQQCDERYCLIKEEMTNSFWMGDFMNVVDGLDDVFNIASSICGIFPTVASILQQIGTTITTIGVTLGSTLRFLPGVSQAVSCALWKTGDAIYGSGDFIMETIWRGHIKLFGIDFSAITTPFVGDSPFSLEFICDVLVNCKFPGDLDIFEGWQNIVDGASDGLFVTDWARDLSNGAGKGAQEFLNGPATDAGYAVNPFFPTCETNADCGDFQKCVDKQCHPVDEEPQTPQDLFSTSISDDNLIYNVARMCIPKIIKNLNSYRQLHCTYIECLMSDQTTKDCVVGRNDAFCRKAYGTLFELLGPARLIRAFKNLMLSAFQNAPSLLIQFGYRKACDAMQNELWTAASSPVQCVLPEYKMGFLFMCQIPKTIFDSIDTVENVQTLVESIRTFIESKQAREQWAGHDVCDSVLEQESVVDTYLEGCSCDVEGTTFNPISIGE